MASGDLLLLLVGETLCGSDGGGNVVRVPPNYAGKNPVRWTMELPRDFESGTCWGAFGMLHQVLLLADQNAQPMLRACIPSNATRTELIAIFVRHVEQHPEEYGKDFQIVAINSVLMCTRAKTRRSSESSPVFVLVYDRMITFLV